MGITNLTRQIVPKISVDTIANVKAIKEMPEMILNKLINQGDKSILHVDMNQCGAAIIKENGILTVYTDALAGCNAFAAIMKTLGGNPLVFLSHYVSTANNNQIAALTKQLETYVSYIDKTYRPKLFFNIRGIKNFKGELESPPNLIVEKVKNLFSKFFTQGYDTQIDLYPTAGRGAFFSSANIFQFDNADLNKVKVTTVGEKEHFIDLRM